VDRRAHWAEAVFGLELDARLRASRLAAIVLVVGALRLAAGARFLPKDVDRTAILGVAMLALASAVAALLLPWRRYPMWSATLPLIWVVALITLIGAWAGGLSHFVGFYGLTSLYAGLTQKKGAWVWIGPLYLTSVALALLGNEPSSSFADVIGGAALSVIIGEVLARAIARGRCVHSRYGGHRRPRAHAEKEHVCIVHGHPRPREHLESQHSRRDHGVKREQELGDAPVHPPSVGGPICAVHGPVLRVDHRVARRPILDGVVLERARLCVLRVDRAEVQEAEVARIDVAFQPLEPVAVALNRGDDHLVVGQHVRLEVRHWRRR